MQQLSEVTRRRSLPIEAPTIGELFVESCIERGPGRLVVRSPMASNALGSATLSALSETGHGALVAVAGIARRLLQQGLATGDFLVCFGSHSHSDFLVNMACACTGIIPIPVSSLYSVRFVEEGITEPTKARHVWSPNGAPPPISPGIVGLTNADLVPDTMADDWREAEAFLRHQSSQLTGESWFMIQPTSGSTGLPKLVPRQHKSLLRYVKWWGAELAALDGDQRMLIATAFTHAMAHHMSLVGLGLRAEIAFPEAIDVETSLREAQDLAPTILPMTPRVLRALFRQHQNHILPFLGDSARVLLSAGATPDQELLDYVASQSVEVVEWYGSSEAGLICLTPLGGWRPGHVGKPAPDVELRLDANGELLLRSPGVTPGYLGRSGGQEQLFVADGFVRSGDFAELMDDGYVRILGRRRDVFNTPEGSNIYPQAIESRLEGHPLVSQALLLGDQLPYVAALIVPVKQAGDGTETTEALARVITELNAQLETLEQIRKFVVVDEAFDPSVYRVVGQGKVRRDRTRAIEFYSAEFATLYGTEQPSRPTQPTQNPAVVVRVGPAGERSSDKSL